MPFPDERCTDLVNVGLEEYWRMLSQSRERVSSQTSRTYLQRARIENTLTKHEDNV